MAYPSVPGASFNTNRSARAFDFGAEANLTHPDYCDMEEAWETMTDAGIGSRAIKRGGIRYLPMLSWKKDRANKYDAYRNRAIFPNAVRRTKVGLEGQVFYKDPTFHIDPALVPEPETHELLACFNRQGASAKAYSREVFGQQMLLGRVGSLTDIGVNAKGKLLPHSRWYGALDIRDWDYEEVNGEQELTFLKLREVVEIRQGFKVQLIEQLRVIELVPMEEVPDEFQGYKHEDPDRPYVTRHRILRRKDPEGSKVGGGRKKAKPNKVAQEEKWVIVDTFFPHKREVFINRIPFVFVNASTLTSEVEEPPLYEMAQINISLYMNSADLENGRHYTGLPQPFAFGVKAGTELEIGSSAWVSDNHQAHVGYLEFIGQGLMALERAIIEKQQQMIAQGARLIESQKRASETFEAQRLRQMSEWSVLANMARLCAEGMSKVLKFHVWMSDMLTWEEVNKSQTDGDGGIKESVECRFNLDFDNVAMTGQEALNWIEGHMAGGLSYEALVAKLRSGEAYPVGWTDKQEIAKLKELMRKKEAAQAIKDAHPDRGGLPPGGDPKQRSDDKEEKPNEQQQPTK